MRNLGVIITLAVCLAAGSPGAAEDWFRTQHAENWLRYPGTIQVDGKPNILVVGYPGGTKGTMVAATIPAKGDIAWLNFLFVCSEHSAKVVNAWTTNRKGSLTRDDGTEARFTIVPEGTLTDDIFNLACNDASEGWAPIAGDVLAAVEQALAPRKR
jgi:hypothetical protein